MSLTDGFDIVLQVTAGCVTRILHAQHFRQAIMHRRSGVDGTNRYDLVINAPEVVFDDSAGPVPSAHAKARVFYNRRRSDTPSDVGVSAVADVLLPVDVSLSNGNPGAAANARVSFGVRTSGEPLPA